MWCGVVRCGVVRCSAGVMWCGVVWCGTFHPKSKNQLRLWTKNMHVAPCQQAEADPGNTLNFSFYGNYSSIQNH